MKSYEDRVYEIIATMSESLAKVINYCQYRRHLPAVSDSLLMSLFQTRPNEPLAQIRKVMIEGPGNRKPNVIASTLPS